MKTTVNFEERCYQTKTEENQFWANVNHLHSFSGRVIISIMVVMATFMMTSCEQEPGVQPEDEQESILPENFKIDIPSSLSSEIKKSASLKNTEADTLKGNQIYKNLTYFVAIGEEAADIVENIIRSIKKYDIQDVIELTYTSDDDGRIKHLVVEEGINFDGRDWQYQLTLTDLESEEAADGGKGLQVFWSNNPTKGVAIIKPYNLNRNDDGAAGMAMYSVEYSEDKLGDYDAHMIIEITGLPLPAASIDRFAVDAIKMFVGKNGDIIDVYGNSNHPNARFFTDEEGFNWAFVASGSKREDVAVAEVGLPSSALDATSREIILNEFSIKNVLTKQINIWFLDKFGMRPDSSDLATYLMNTEAPGFFDNNGFIQGGTAPDRRYSVFEGRIKELIPYNPKSISELEISFKE